MDKIKLLAAGLDGQTLVSDPPTFELREGWLEARLPAPAGVLPAGLWDRVPAGDPYLLHVAVLTTAGLAVGDFFELQTGEPVQPREQFAPTPGNTRLVLVRPSDRLRLAIAPQASVKVELLIESIGGTNELGTRLREWAAAHAQARAAGVRTAKYSGGGEVPAWTGLLHLVYDSPVSAPLILPPRALVPLDARLTVTRRSAGFPNLTVTAPDTIAGGQISVLIKRSTIVMNNGDEWTLAGE